MYIFTNVNPDKPCALGQTVDMSWILDGPWLGNTKVHGSSFVSFSLFGSGCFPSVVSGQKNRRGVREEKVFDFLATGHWPLMGSRSNRRASPGRSSASAFPGGSPPCGPTPLMGFLPPGLIWSRRSGGPSAARSRPETAATVGGPRTGAVPVGRGHLLLRPFVSAEKPQRRI